MSDINRDNRSRRAIVVSILLLVAIAAIVILIIRQRRHMKQEQQASENVQMPPQGPMNPGKGRIGAFLEFYSRFDTAHLSENPNLMAIVFRQMMPVLDEEAHNARINPQSIGKLKENVMRNLEMMAAEPGTSPDSRKLKTALLGAADLLDTIATHLNPKLVDQTKEMHNIASKINSTEIFYNQKPYISPYFRTLYQVMAGLEPPH